MFELITGYPLFDDGLASKDVLVRDWISTLGPLPDEWKDHVPPKAVDTESDEGPLTDRLHETYFEPHRLYERYCEDDVAACFAEAHFEDNKTVRFAEAHIEVLEELLDSMMQYRPSDRPPIFELLKHPWFEKNPFRTS